MQCVWMIWRAVTGRPCLSAPLHMLRHLSFRSTAVRALSVEEGGVFGPVEEEDEQQEMEEDEEMEEKEEEEEEEAYVYRLTTQTMNGS